MYVLAAHPVHIKALNNTGKSNKSIVESKYLSSYYRFIQNELIKNLELGKTNLFVVPDHINPEFVPKLLAYFKLSRLAAVIEGNSPITQKQLAQLKALSKSEKKQYNPKNYEVSKAHAHKLQQKLKAAYNLLNRPIFGNRSWNFIATNNNFYSLHEEVSLLRQKLKVHDFQFTQSEYWLMRGRIEEAMKLYNPDFRFLEKSDKLSIRDVADAGIEKSLEFLKSFSRRCQLLNYRFSRFIEEYSRHFYQEGLREIEEINQMLEKLIVKQNEFEVRFGHSFDDQMGLQGKIKQRFSTSFKEQVDARNELKELTLALVQKFNDSPKYDLDVDTSYPDEIHQSYVKEVISKATLKIDHWRKAVTKYKDHCLKQINLLNSDRSELKELDREFQNLINDINRSKIFLQPFEDNTFNILKKIEFISEVKQTVNQAQWLVTYNPDYIHWRIVSEHYPQEVIHFMEGLRDFQTERWIILFDRFYIEEITKQNFHPNIPSNFNTLDKFLENCDRYREETLHWIEYLWEKKRLQALEDLQKSDKWLHTALFKKSRTENLSLQKMLLKSPGFLKTYFPVIVMKESEIKSIRDQFKKEWDSVWIVGDEKPMTIDINRMESLGQTFIQIKNLSSENVEKDLFSAQVSPAENAHELTVDYEELITPFKLLQKSEILSTCKRISSRLSFVKEKQRIFQLKNRSIVSFLTDQNNEKLVQLLDTHGIKEIIHKSKDETDLVDVLVDMDRELVLLTQDGLLDSADIDSAEWQYRQLKILQNLGVKWINIWTSSYYYEEGDVLQKALISMMNMDSIGEEQLATIK